ncbi:unnamed protein product [Amoebophrya sp. A120]|nr:unnamed protein product [Amoebophrya sp. A120]|eukprot:GSA120T00001793001.1
MHTRRSTSFSVGYGWSVEILTRKDGVLEVFFPRSCGCVLSSHGTAAGTSDNRAKRGYASGGSGIFLGQRSFLCVGERICSANRRCRSRTNQAEERNGKCQGHRGARGEGLVGHAEKIGPVAEHAAKRGGLSHRGTAEGPDSAAAPRGFQRALGQGKVLSWSR